MLAVALCACSSTDAVEIRACNLTGEAITDVTYESSMVGALAAGECSAYETATHDVYRYTYATFAIGTETFTAQPIDFVGERPLSPGRWSYELRIVDRANHGASADVVED